MKKTLALLLSILMLAMMAVPAMATDAVCPKCEMNTFIYYMTVTPNCTEQGYTLWKCNNPECGYEEKINEVAALGHYYITDYTHVNEGCSLSDKYESGKKYSYDHRYCDRCGFDDQINKTMNPVHEYETIKTLAANCTQPERYLKECKYCHDTKEETVPGGDPYTYHKMDIVISAPKTCNDEAVIVYECVKCGYQSSVATDPIDHVDEDADGVCDICEVQIVLDEEPHGFYAQIIKWISEIVEAFKAFLAAIKGDSLF